MSESSGLPPEQEAVRRLLADARHDGPPPPDVVARLDETLASLVAERESRAHRRARDRARRPLAGTRRRPRLPPTPGGGHRPAGRRLRRRRGCRDRPGPPPRRQRLQRVECRLAVRLLARRVPRGRGLQRRLEHQLRRRPGRGLRCRLRARAGVAEELSRQPPSPACRACRRRTPTSTTSSSPCGRRAPPVGSSSPRSTRSVTATSPVRAGPPPWSPRRSTAGPGWSCSVAPSARRRASSSTCAARPFRCVRSRCPRPERCGRAVEQRSPTIG